MIAHPTPVKVTVNRSYLADRESTQVQPSGGAARGPVRDRKPTVTMRHRKYDPLLQEDSNSSLALGRQKKRLEHYERPLGL